MGDNEGTSEAPTTSGLSALRDAQRARWEENKRKTQELQQQQQKAASSSSATAATSSSASSQAAAPHATGTNDNNPRRVQSISPKQPLRELNATPGATGSSSNLGATPSNPSLLSKIHILPLGLEQKVPDNMMGFLGSCLKKFRNEKTIMYSGKVFDHNGLDFITMKCDPENEYSILGPDTEYYFMGPPVARFKRVQFSALVNCLKKPEDPEPAYDEDIKNFSTERLFQEYIAPHFQSHSENEKTGGIFKILNVNQDVSINGLQFVTMATDPESTYGIVDKKTLIYVDKDETPEYRRIHIVPFQDTLPRSYEYDVFNDYLKPYCKAHVNQRYRVNDVFTYNGVQFKVVCCDPEELGGTNNVPGVGARIGKNTTIYCDGVLHPQLRDLLPPELVAQLAYLPPGLQMLLLSTDAVGGNQELFERLMEVQDMLQHRRGMSEETIANVVEEKIDLEELTKKEDAQLTCMVCLSDFDEGETVRRLPCNHRFHSQCIDEWMRRSCECPICKHNIDRAIRNY